MRSKMLFLPYYIFLLSYYINGENLAWLGRAIKGYRNTQSAETNYRQF